MVNTFRKYRNDISMVRCEAKLINELDLKYIGDYKSQNDNVYLFEECLFSKNGYWYTPGGYMLRVSLLDTLIPKREIYTNKEAGQNYQIMLPYLYKHKCITIKKQLYNIVIRDSSHSREVYKSYDKRIHLMQIYENTILETLDKISTIQFDKRNGYKLSIKHKFLIDKLRIAIDYKRKKDIQKIRTELFEQNISIPKSLLLQSFSPILYQFILMIRKYIYN